MCLRDLVVMKCFQKHFEVLPTHDSGPECWHLRGCVAGSRGEVPPGSAVLNRGKLTLCIQPL